MALQKISGLYFAKKSLSFLFAFFSLVSGVLIADTGLVLTGGGGKGAYEVGVWKALKELGIAKDIHIISGTSVGALNATLFATHTNVSDCIAVWTNQISKIGGPNPNTIAEIKKTIKSDDYSTLKMIKFLYQSNSIFDPKPLQETIRSIMPPSWSRNAPNVYVTTLEKGKLSQKPWRRQVFHLNNETSERCIQMLLASSAFPLAFDNIVIDGKQYVDGGWDDMGGDNTPIGPVIEHSKTLDKIIIVFLQKIKKEEASKIATIRTKHPDIKIIEIEPSRELGGLFSGIMNFSKNHASELIDLGYNDAMRKLRHLR